MSSAYFHGSCWPGGDFITNRFYLLMTQMGSGLLEWRKDIYTMNTLTNSVNYDWHHTESSLNDYHIVKIAMSPTGVGYMPLV